MTSFHFGSRQRRLFGYYEPAQGNFTKARAVLLCHPMGNEQVFAYRTMRQLSARLVRSGFHVLRFDYFGTGDSYGDTGEGDFESWCGDIETAIEELKEMTRATKVNLVGLRLGANLSAQVAAGRRKDISKLVLWDPLADGDAAAARSKFENGKRMNGPEGAHGDLVAKAALLPPSTFILLTAEPPSPDEFGRLTVEHLPQAAAWDEERLLRGSIPTAALQRIVDWLQ